ncbi:hypothetical protein BDZ90DRAFT_54727 [Jaminaea rosea]|uniref:Signal recognition particle receptor subunit beta n=1 Tax=Jaminaea rosea TaxID=1569628 RepID=A0A316UL27_9BASI|nr:hypothetical protein BDZ90DRAFT_54727 [Jaminaea rosea]PWN25957.1 hypothetical protein BDZ90DRAFT_54727 [Jaminaea rosea]
MAFLGPPVRWPDALPIDNDASPFYPLASSLRRILPGPLATLPSSILVSITLTFLLITGIAIFSAVLNARRSSLLVSEKAVPASSSATQRRKSGQPITALLVGPEQTGKSSIFSALVFQAVPETQTSQHENESRITLRAEGHGEKAVEQPVQLVDLPGHPRLRGRVGDFLSVADKIVFCVDTTTAIRGASTKNDTLIEAVE